MHKKSVWINTILSAAPNNKYWGRCVFNFQNFRTWHQREKKAKMLIVTPKRHPSAAPPCPRRPPALRRWTPTTLSWTSWLLWCSPLPLIGLQGKCIHAEVFVSVVKGLIIINITQYSVQSFTQGAGDNCGGVQTFGADEQVDHDKIQWHEPNHWKHIEVGLQSTYWSLLHLYGVYVSEVSRIWTPNTLNFCPI